MSIVRINSLGITDGTIVNGDINASAGITLAKLSGVNDAKAWVNFNGTGTVAIRASFNVTSITDGGTGVYTVNFTNAITDADYCAQITIGTTLSSAPELEIFTTTTLQIATKNNSSAAEDKAFVCISVFR